MAPSPGADSRKSFVFKSSRYDTLAVDGPAATRTARIRLSEESLSVHRRNASSVIQQQTPTSPLSLDFFSFLDPPTTDSPVIRSVRLSASTSSSSSTASSPMPNTPFSNSEGTLSDILTLSSGYTNHPAKSSQRHSLSLTEIVTGMATPYSSPHGLGLSGDCGPYPSPDSDFARHLRSSTQPSPTLKLNTKKTAAKKSKRHKSQSPLSFGKPLDGAQRDNSGDYSSSSEKSFDNSAWRALNEECSSTEKQPT